MTNRYESAWESFWSDVPDVVGAATWDSDPSLIAAVDRTHFEAYFERTLPLLDFGCGNGTQTRFLAELYPRVIGVDLSAAALAIARKVNRAPNVDYLRMDVLDPADTETLHKEVGDLNVYIRGVLHQLDPVDRPTAVAALAALAGVRGHVFASELAPSAHALLHDVISGRDGPPAKLARVFRHGITPAELQEGELRELFSEGGFEVLLWGERTETYTESLADGSPLTVPFEYLVARRMA